MKARQRGLSLVAALFLIVVLAAIGTFAVRIGVAEQQQTTAALLEHRALAAAHAGIEIGANRALTAASCPASQSVLLQQGFTVTIDCTSLTPPFYRITSTARRGTFGAPEFVSRTVVRTLSNAP
jgi:MSHA biogenesis protein MshP